MEIIFQNLDYLIYVFLGSFSFKLLVDFTASSLNLGYQGNRLFKDNPVLFWFILLIIVVFGTAFAVWKTKSRTNKTVEISNSDHSKKAKKRKRRYLQNLCGNTPEAMFNSGVMYRKKGVRQNIKASFECYKAAADLGHARAMNNLAWFYHGGRFVVKDCDKAHLLWQKAVEKRNDLAANNIASDYLNGKCRGKDIEKAIFWLKKADELGHHSAGKTLEKIRKKRNIFDWLFSAPESEEKQYQNEDNSRHDHVSDGKGDDSSSNGFEEFFEPNVNESTDSEDTPSESGDDTNNQKEEMTSQNTWD